MVSAAHLTIDSRAVSIRGKIHFIKVVFLVKVRAGNPQFWPVGRPGSLRVVGATPFLPARDLGQLLESQGHWGVGPEHMQPLADLGGRRWGAWGLSLGVTAPALFFQPGF